MARTLFPADRWFTAAPACPSEALADRLARLPRRAQQVLLLSRLDECSYPQIAHAVGCNLERVEQELIAVLDATRDDAGSSAASRWYVQLQSPSITASARIDFRRWLDADNRHLHAFHQTELLWRSLLAPARVLAEGAQRLQGRRRHSLRHWLAGLLTVMLLGLLALP